MARGIQGGLALACQEKRVQVIVLTVLVCLFIAWNIPNLNPGAKRVYAYERAGKDVKLDREASVQAITYKLDKLENLVLSVPKMTVDLADLAGGGNGAAPAAPTAAATPAVPAKALPSPIEKPTLEESMAKRKRVKSEQAPQIKVSGQVAQMMQRSVRENTFTEDFMKMFLYGHEITTKRRTLPAGKKRRFAKGQGAQDVWMYEHLVDLMERNGVFVEFGGRNGISESNTYLFEKALHWTGVMIEADPKEFSNMKSNRPGTHCLNGPVCPSTQNEVTFGSSKIGGWGGVVDAMSPETHEQVKNTQTMRCLHLASVLDQYNIQHVHYMTVDIEGYEIPVLSDFDFTKYTVDFVQVERNIYYKEVIHELTDLAQLMFGKGYIVVQFFKLEGHTADMLFMRKDLLPQYIDT